MVEKIKRILGGELRIIQEHDVLGCPYPEIGGIDAAAQAIQKLIDEHPVDRVRAMAALTWHGPNGVYYVPGAQDYIVRQRGGQFFCTCDEGGYCEHVRAVQLYLKQTITAGDGRWYTPDGYVVEQHGDELVCSCLNEDCGHVRAVRVYQERAE